MYIATYLTILISEVFIVILFFLLLYKEQSANNRNIILTYICNKEGALRNVYSSIRSYNNYRYSAFMQVYKDYVRGGGKIVCAFKNVDIKTMMIM